MIQSFQFYLHKGLVRKTGKNPSLARSLFQKAQLRLNKITRETIREDESSLIFEDVYESIREAAQALLQIQGYKPYSHEALISFLKDEHYFSPSIINTLDRYRVLRNKSVYEAKKISVETCKEALVFAQSFLPRIKQTL